MDFGGRGIAHIWRDGTERSSVSAGAGALRRRLIGLKARPRPKDQFGARNVPAPSVAAACTPTQREETMLTQTHKSSAAAVKAWLKKWHPWPVWAFLLLVVLLVLLARAAAAESGARAKILAEGKQDYEENCVACHGADGTGRGQLAAKLVKPPADLTGIAARNGGQFPFWRVFDIVAGETMVPGHDTFQMPEFFASMKHQDFKPGYLPAHVRLLELTLYLESLQKK
jgi:mono/diheme cytochrome c family protein